MNANEIIRKKRNGHPLSPQELVYFIHGYVDGTIPDYQMSALLMATYFQGMEGEETKALTTIMLESGEIVDLSFLPGIKVDKHSTGGVGDKISLPLAAVVAACGVPVPMISGRGLGHTGGTLDKLEAIPGFRTSLSVDEYKNVIQDIGLVMIGQTDTIAPADKKMYALRDVTSTVECIPLIAGSIMSKKLAEGIDALVLDVKTGRGAFMQSYENAAALAHTLVNIGNGLGKQTVAYITTMDEPLGYAIGHWNEVVESLQVLQGVQIPQVTELTEVIGGTMVLLGKKASSLQEGITLCKEAIRNGSAYEKFLKMVERQGGDVRFLEDTSIYPKSRHHHVLSARNDGYISSIDALELGFAMIELGGGRTKVVDTIDHKAGIMVRKKTGDAVRKGETIAEISTDRSILESTVLSRIDNAFSISPEPTAILPLIRATVDATGISDFTNPV